MERLKHKCFFVKVLCGESALRIIRERLFDAKLEVDAVYEAWASTGEDGFFMPGVVIECHKFDKLQKALSFFKEDLVVGLYPKFDNEGTPLNHCYCSSGYLSTNNPEAAAEMLQKKQYQRFCETEESYFEFAIYNNLSKTIALSYGRRLKNSHESEETFCRKRQELIKCS